MCVCVCVCVQRPPPSPDKGRLNKACAAIDEANSKDPRKVPYNGQNQPYRLLYSQWTTEWVNKLEPQASEELLLLARGASKTCTLPDLNPEPSDELLLLARGARA